MDFDFRSQVPTVSRAMLSDLRVVTRRMADLGFNEANIEDALGVRPLSFRRLHCILPYRARLKAYGSFYGSISCGTGPPRHLWCCRPLRFP